jgi:hypothetical protein
MVDWAAIKTEYITTATSYRKLADKYGVSYATIGVRAKEEGWVAEKRQYTDETLTKTLDAVSDTKVSEAVLIHETAGKLLSKIGSMVEYIDPKKTSAKEAKALAGALKDIKELCGVKSDLDMKEQEARIANLRRQAQGDDSDVDEIEINILGGDSSWQS